MLRGFPHRLGEEAPVVEVGHVGIGLSVEAVEGGYLGIVEGVRNDLTDLVRGRASNNALAIASTLSSPKIWSAGRICQKKRYQLTHHAGKRRHLRGPVRFSATQIPKLRLGLIDSCGESWSATRSYQGSRGGSGLVEKAH